MARSGPHLLGATAYFYRLTAASHTAALGLMAGLVLLLAFGDALAHAAARRVIRWLTCPESGVAQPAEVDPAL